VSDPCERVPSFRIGMETKTYATAAAVSIARYPCLSSNRRVHQRIFSSLRTNRIRITHTDIPIYGTAVAQLADTQEHMTTRTTMTTDNRPPSAVAGFNILACIDSDHLPLPTAVTAMVHNYLPTTCSIRRASDDDDVPVPVRKAAQSTDVRSVWSAGLERHDVWKRAAVLPPATAVDSERLSGKGGRSTVRVCYAIDGVVDGDGGCEGEEEEDKEELRWIICK